MIVVFGSINLDLVARVARLPRAGETVAGDSFAALPGGKGANQALAAFRAGAGVAMVGAVGNDVFAAIALSGLAEAGVDCADVRHVDAPTGIALIHVDASGENAITVIPGANAHTRATQVPDEALGPGTTLLLQLEVPVAQVCEIAVRARQRGARVVLNAAPVATLPPELVAALDALVVNELEALSLAAGLALSPRPEDFATELHQRLGCAVVVTRGARGALLAVDDRLWSARPPIVDVVDATGAGDAFTGAFSAAIDRAAGWPQALADGVAAGSLACCAVGAQAALPDARAVAELAAKVVATME